MIGAHAGEVLGCVGDWNTDVAASHSETIAEGSLTDRTAETASPSTQSVIRHYPNASTVANVCDSRFDETNPGCDTRTQVAGSPDDGSDRSSQPTDVASVEVNGPLDTPATTAVLDGLLEFDHISTLSEAICPATPAESRREPAPSTDGDHSSPPPTASESDRHGTPTASETSQRTAYVANSSTQQPGPSRKRRADNPPLEDGGPRLQGHKKARCPTIAPRSPTLGKVYASGSGSRTPLCAPRTQLAESSRAPTQS